MGMAKQVTELSKISSLNTITDPSLQPFKNKTVSVIGLGYVGLPTAALVASRGVKVIGVDINAEAVSGLNEGRTHIQESDLDDVVQKAVGDGNLRAVTVPEKADVYIIAVPTPLNEYNEPDLFAVKSAFASLVPVLEKGDLIILESTSPVGTTEMMSDFLDRARPDLTFPTTNPEEADISVAYCPERILPGNTLNELVSNSRVIGGIDKKSAQEAAEFYRLFCKGELSFATAREAEASKLVENAYRDVNIAFANEISVLCEDMDINPFRVIRTANKHPRVNILNPGPGVGGHCIPIDPCFLINAAPEKTSLMTAARYTNDFKTQHVYEKLKLHALQYREPVIAVLGLSYKPDVDDIRESPSVEIVKQAMADNLADLLIVEPNLDCLPHSLSQSDRVRMVNLEAALAEASVVVVLVGHSQFKILKSKDLSDKIVIDTIGLLQ